MNDSMRPRPNVIGPVVAVASLLIALFAHAVYISSEFTEVKVTARQLGPRIDEVKGELAQMRQTDKQDAVQAAELRMMIKAVAEQCETAHGSKRR